MTKRLRFCLILILSLVLTLCLSACGCRHDYGEWEVVREATCLKEGRQERECEKCGDVKSKSIPKGDHDYKDGDILTPATCLEDGEMEQVCSVCDDTKTVAVPKGDHDYQQEVTAVAGCHGNGTYTYTCSLCDDTYTEDIPTTTYTATEIHNMYLDSVGEVVVYDKQGNELGLGSCFVYKQDGTLITNYHVIEGAYSADVTFGDKSYSVDKVLAYDIDIDIAILKISADGLDAVTLCDEDHNVGDAVYAFGSSKGLTATFSDGMITYSNREVGGVAYVQHDVPISGGNSGGPLINAYGEVIGINTWTVVDSQNLNFAIHLSELDNLVYGNAMTLTEVYEEECDPYKKMKSYAMSEGEYSNGSYSVLMATETGSDYEYYWILSYYTDSDTVALMMALDDATIAGVAVDSETSGFYKWVYTDSYDYTMSGWMSAGSFTGNDTLSCTDSNVSSYSLETALRELATIMIRYTCTNMDSIIGDLGITAADLGFTNF